MPLGVSWEGQVEIFYPTFFFEGTFNHESIETELRIVLDLKDGAPYAKAEQYYDSSDRLVLDGTKSSQYKCQWGYCEQRPGVESVEVPAGTVTVEGVDIVPVESRWNSLEVYWLDGNTGLIGRDLKVYPEETPLYPITLIVISEIDGVKRVDTDVLESPLPVPTSFPDYNTSGLFIGEPWFFPWWREIWEKKVRYEKICYPYPYCTHYKYYYPYKNDYLSADSYFYNFYLPIPQLFYNHTSSNNYNFNDYNKLNYYYDFWDSLNNYWWLGAIGVL